jgi:hypothetical protein
VLLRQKGEQNLIKGDETDQSLMKTDMRLRDNSGGNNLDQYCCGRILKIAIAINFVIRSVLIGYSAASVETHRLRPWCWISRCSSQLWGSYLLASLPGAHACQRSIIPDNAPSVMRTVIPRRQRRQPRVTYLSQSLLAVAMIFFILGLWFGANQPIF